MRIVRGYQRNSGALGEIDERFTNSRLWFQPMLLNLEEVIPLPHDLLKLECLGRSVIKTILREQSRRHARHARGQRDQSRAMLSEKFFVDARLVIEAFGECFGG